MPVSKTAWLCAATIAGLGVAVAPAAFADRYDRQVRLQLMQMEEMLEERGYVETHSASFDRLNEGRTDRLSFVLDEGREYFVVAACDNDCSDVDLKLYDENDNLVGKDIETDDTPVVRITPRWTGTFDLHVDMHTCAAEPCTYGVTIFSESKRRGSRGRSTRL